MTKIPRRPPACVFVHKPVHPCVAQASQAADTAAICMTASLLIDGAIANKYLTSSHPLVYMGGGMATAVAVSVAQAYVAVQPPSPWQKPAQQALRTVAPLSAAYLGAAVGLHAAPLSQQLVMGLGTAGLWAAAGRWARR